MFSQCAIGKWYIPDIEPWTGDWSITCQSDSLLWRLVPECEARRLRSYQWDLISAGDRRDRQLHHLTASTSSSLRAASSTRRSPPYIQINSLSYHYTKKSCFDHFDSKQDAAHQTSSFSLKGRQSLPWLPRRRSVLPLAPDPGSSSKLIPLTASPEEKDKEDKIRTPS